MKLMFLGIAGAVVASALTPVPASAQRWHDSRGWHDGRYQHSGRWNYAPRGNYRRGYWDGRRWYTGGRHRTICTWQRGRYGRVEVCRRR